MSAKLRMAGCAAALGLATACATAAGPSPSPPTATLLPLVPTGTATPARAALTAQPTPGPSPTPLTHVVEQGDTLLGIAIQYGVELNDLLAANAGVNPRFLSVGQAILIPGPEGGPAVGLLPTATPVPVALSPVNCYATLEGSLWCLCTAHNPSQLALEGIGALVTLGSAAGEPLRSEPAYAPLNVLPPGGDRLLAAFFTAPVPDHQQAQASLVSAVAAAELEGRYAATELALEPAVSGPAGTAWEVAGEVELPDFDGDEPIQVHVLVVAYDRLDRPVGFAKQILEASPTATFSITVASLGPPIERVEAFAEAPLPAESDG